MKANNVKKCVGKEIWGNLKGYERVYQASNRGNVRSLKEGDLISQIKCDLFNRLIPEDERQEFLKYRATFEIT